MQSTVADRNNNPGNLRDASTGGFRTFSTPDEGYAALLNDLQGKMTGATSTGLSGKSTLFDFASKYAPSGDSNDPAQYTANLANTLGVAPNTPLSDLQPRIGDLAQAIAKNEGYTAAKGFVAQAPDPTQGNAVAPEAQGTPDLPSYGALFPAAPGDNPLVAGLKAAGNLPGSAIGFGKSIFDAVSHPIDTLTSLGKTAIGGAEKLTGQAPDTNTQTFDSFVKVLADRYGGLDQLQNTATNDPFGFATDIISLASGGAGLAGKSAELTDLAGTAARAVTRPLEGTLGATADIAKGVGAYGAAKATGLEPATIAEIVRNPTAFTPQAIAESGRIDTAMEVEKALNDRISALQETGTGYNAIRDLRAPNMAVANEETKIVPLGGSQRLVYHLADAPDHILSLPELRKKLQILTEDSSSPTAAIDSTKNAISAMELVDTVPHPIRVPKRWLVNQLKDTFGVDIGRDGKFTSTLSSKVRDPKDLRALENLYQQSQPAFEKGSLTPEEFLNFRTELAKLAKFDREVSKSSVLENLSGILRGDFNNQFRGQIPGLGDTVNKRTGALVSEGLDTKYSRDIQELETLRKGIIDKDGKLLPSAVNAIANAAGKGKDLQLAKLEKIIPGITQKIKIQKAMEDIAAASGNKVGTYTKTALETGGIVGGLVTGNIPLVAGALAAAIAATPEVAVPLLRAYGMNKALVSNVMARLRLSSAMNLPALTATSEVSRATAPVESSAAIPDITPAPSVSSPVADTGVPAPIP